MAGYSVARRVNYCNCKCMENYQFFRRVKPRGELRLIYDGGGGSES